MIDILVSSNVKDEILFFPLSLPSSSFQTATNDKPKLTRIDVFVVL